MTSNSAFVFIRIVQKENNVGWVFLIFLSATLYFVYSWPFLTQFISVFSVIIALLIFCLNQKEFWAAYLLGPMKLLIVLSNNYKNDPILQARHSLTSKIRNFSAIYIFLFQIGHPNFKLVKEKKIKNTFFPISATIQIILHLLSWSSFLSIFSFQEEFHFYFLSLMSNQWYHDWILIFEWIFYESLSWCAKYSNHYFKVVLEKLFANITNFTISRLREQLSRQNFTIWFDIIYVLCSLTRVLY